jgi:TIR domain
MNDVHSGTSKAGAPESTRDLRRYTGWPLEAERAGTELSRALPGRKGGATVALVPSIFISYRREDTSGEAGRLADDLAERFGRSSVFIDVDAIAPGADFEARIHQALDASQLAVVLIGNRWLTSKLPDGTRRLDDSGDYVRQEIAAALARDDVTVVPMLVEGAGMPAAAVLPADISGLSKRNALELSTKRWNYDLGRLVEVAERHDRGWRRALRSVPRWARRGAPIAALALAGAIAAIVATGGGGGPDKAAKVAACERAHGLRSEQDRRPPRSGETRVDPSQVISGVPQTVFASCTWPPPPGADSDGYRAIAVSMVKGPGEGEYTGRTIADRIESRCRTLELEYSHAFMGEQTRFEPFRARPGDIWAPSETASGFARIGKIGTPSGNQAKLLFYPGRDEVIVLHSGHYAPIENVECVD